MAHNIFSNITARGTRAVFQNRLDMMPTVWDKHTQKIPSDAADEQHVFMGQVPQPRQLLDSRSFRPIRDFSYTLANNEYELTFIIDQTSVEDDRHNLINARINEAATVWAKYKDALFATLLEVGEDAGNTAYDGTVFYSASRTIGDSGTIDNTSTAAATVDADNPSSAEILTALKEAKESMWRFDDDTGRPGINAQAMTSLRCVIPPEYERAFAEAVNSTLRGGGDSNPWGLNLVEFDVLADMADADNAFFCNAVGDPTRMPFIYQERTPLQVEVDNNPTSVAEHHGVRVFVRQRFRLGYGDPLRSFRYDFT